MTLKRLLHVGLSTALGLLLLLAAWFVGPAQLQAKTQSAMEAALAAENGVTPTAPEISIDPTQLDHAQAVGTVRSYPLTIQNPGALDLTWTIHEELPAVPVAPLPQNAAAPPAKAPAREVVTSASQCAQYEKYAGAEPIGYATHCLPDTNSTLPDSALPSSQMPLDPTDIGYAQDIGYVSDDFVFFTLNDFAGRTALGTNSMSLFAYSFDRSGTILYALDSTGRELGVVDTGNGAFTPIGPSTPLVGHNWTGLSIHPFTGQAYASSSDSNVSSLYTIDLATGEATYLGDLPGLDILIEISFSPEGVLYGHDIETDAIYTIDIDMMTASLVGPTGYLANFAQGMDFDWSDGTLYIFLYTGGGNTVFGTVDLETGAVTPQTTAAGEFEGAIPNAQICSNPSDIPWAEASPTSGVTSAGGSSEVLVTFDTTGLTVGATYSGSLCIGSNDPNTPWTSVPLTLTVEAQRYGVDVTVGDDALSGEVGDTVAYTTWVTNLGNVADSFDLTATGAWVATPAVASVTLEEGESAAVEVHVDIPADAEDGETVVTTFTATSQTDLAASASVDLTTSAIRGTPHIYLPAFFNE